MSQVETIQLTTLRTEAPSEPAVLVGERDVKIHSSAKAAWVIGILTGVTFVGSMGTGLITIALPAIAEDLALPPHLLLWPATVYPLASSCCLIVAGAVADFLGNRIINLIGCFLLAVWTAAAGAASDGNQFIVFRAFQGVAISLCLPTAISILSNNFVPGRQRNIGFGCIGLSQPVGFAVGMILGGVFVDTIPGWRASFYLTAGMNGLCFALSVWLLPPDRPRAKFEWARFGKEIDWVGAGLASSAFGVFSYVFAILTGDMSKVRRPENIVLICVAGLCVIGFIYWMRYREKTGRLPLIPNSLWSNKAFTAVCIMVMLSHAVLNGMEYFLSLFFQEVQSVNALGTAIRFFPEVALGITLNLCTSLFVDRIQANHLITSSSIIATASPLIMALIDPEWNYWRAAFWAVLLCPVNVDVIFTVANLIITEAFSPDTQALAGAVFNTTAQFGYSVGVMLMAITQTSVTNASSHEDKGSPAALMEGYRSVFWFCFALQVVACPIGIWGLRKAGKVGLKRE